MVKGENMNNIDKNLLSKILNEKGMMLTAKEIEEIMDTETAKPEEEMDTELVDLCATALVQKYYPKLKNEPEIPMFCPWEEETKQQEQKSAQPKKKRLVSFKKVFLVAAVIVLVFAIAIPAGAALFSGDAANSIIEFCEDHFKINLKKEKTTSPAQNELVNQMILESLDSLMLPEELLSDEYQKSVTNIIKDEYKNAIYISITNESNDFAGNLVVTQYNDSNVEAINGLGYVSDMHKYFKHLLINNNDIVVFGNDKQVYINYIDESTGYEIMLNCDFETAVSIAETIK